MKKFTRSSEEAVGPTHNLEGDSSSMAVSRGEHSSVDSSVAVSWDRRKNLDGIHDHGGESDNGVPIFGSSPGNSRHRYVPLDTTSRFEASTIESTSQIGEGNTGLIITRGADSLPHAPLHMKPKGVSETTASRIKFDEVKLHGRDEQLNILQESWRNLCDVESSAARHLILISGPAGTGKTKLASELSRLSVVEERGLVVGGRFEANLTSTIPYSGISKACAEILGAILAMQNLDPEKSRSIQTDISSALGQEAMLLADFIPALPEVIEVSPSSASAYLSFSAEESSNRVIFAFQRFLEVVSKAFDPLIILVDDLHWANDSSLVLLESLLSDEKIPKLLLVGMYRPEEVNEQHCLIQRLDTIKKKIERASYSLQELSVGDLTEREVELIIGDILKRDSFEDPNGQSVSSLAELCKEKTLGNAFFLFQYIASLYESRLLTYDSNQMRWIWDEATIRLKTVASDNVIAVLQAKMNHLDQECLNILRLAAYLGSTFSFRCLNLLWQEGREGDAADDIFRSNLLKLEKVGFLISLAGMRFDSYAWAHDKIHQAALELVPSLERPSVAMKAGETLLLNLDEKEMEAHIFIIANLLSIGLQSLVDVGMSTSSRDLSACFCLAMKKAIKISAFESAAEYARIGIGLLSNDSWVTAYDLSLDLYSLGAKAAGYLRQNDVMESYIQEVLGQSYGSDMDKLRVYNVLIESMVFGGRIKEAIPIILGVLRRYGVRFPTRRVPVLCSIVRGLFRTQGTMKRMKASILRKMTDPLHEELMDLMRRLNVCFYIENDTRYPLTGFQAVNWAPQYGVCGASAMGFAQAGIVVLAATEDFKGALNYATLALEIVKITSSERYLSAVLMTAYLAIYPWTTPLDKCLAPLLDAYNLGLRFGDTDSATAAILHYIIFKYMSGGDLSTMAEELAMYTRQMFVLDRLLTFNLGRILLQAFLNLKGRDNSENSTHMTGYALPEDGQEEANSVPVMWAAMITFGGILKTFFGKHVSAADDIVRHGSDCITKIFVGSHSGVLDVFLKGMSCYAAALETGKRKYSAVAKKLHAKIDKWAKKGNPNVSRYKLMLDAERLVLQRKPQEAIGLFEDAIRASARARCQQDAAFACEKLGELYLVVIKNEDEAAHRFEQARGYWLSWGAMAKVAHLDMKYETILAPRRVASTPGEGMEGSRLRTVQSIDEKTS